MRKNNYRPGRKYRQRIITVRLVVEAMPCESAERKVSVCYMRNYDDGDIRAELALTKKKLMETKKKIKELLTAAGLEDM